MSLKDTYQAVLAATTRPRDIAFAEHDGKLHITAAVDTEEQKNRIWMAIKTVPTWHREVVAEIRVQPKSAAPKTHTVKAGDTLSGIAERYFGDANLTTKILDANRDLLVAPDKIRPGQVLRIPA